MLVTRISVSLTRFIAPPGKPGFGILASQRGSPLDRDLTLKWLKLDNSVFHDQKIPETFRARTVRNFTK